MTTPTDTRTAFQAWYARAMELADAIASAQVNDDRDHGLVAARAALSEHLSELPMGEPVAEAIMNLCADHQGPVEAMAYIPEGTFLFRHPKDTA